MKSSERLRIAILCSFLSAGWIAAQTGRLTFEVASVKAVTVPAGVTVNGGSILTTGSRDDFQRLRSTGGPGTTDPGRIHYPLVSLKGLLNRAFETYFEIDAPAWADTAAFSVDATMPADTTKEHFREMLINLLIDRFQMQYHVSTKEISGYVLTVAKNGPKLKEAAELPPQDESAPAPRPRQIGPDGFPVPPARIGAGFMIAGMPGDRARIVGQQQTMASLANQLGKLLNSKVVDSTGLAGKCDITLSYAGRMGGPNGAEALLAPPAASADPNAPEPLPDIFSALQSQLGLRLEAKNVLVEFVAVDHIEKTPVGN